MATGAVNAWPKAKWFDSTRPHGGNDEAETKAQWSGERGTLAPRWCGRLLPCAGSVRFRGVPRGPWCEWQAYSALTRAGAGSTPAGPTKQSIRHRTMVVRSAL